MTTTTVQTCWPELAYSQWQDTAETLHLWMQVIGKIKLKLATRTNHWWHITLHPTSRGLTTLPMPYGTRTLEIVFDFLAHDLILQCAEGPAETIKLQPMSVAEFYSRVMSALDVLGMPLVINKNPSELADAIPFDEDHTHASYDAEAVTRYWQALLSATRVFTQFRAKFLGKVSPVHLFWGAVDLAVTRFSGRLAPEHASVPNIPDHVVKTAYSHEVSSAGFWPGGQDFREPIFYSYAYPAPEGYGDAKIEPAEAQFVPTLGEFVLPYEAVRKAANPDEYLMTFLQSTYEAAADLGAWDRQALEAADINI